MEPLHYWLWRRKYIKRWRRQQGIVECPRKVGKR